MDAAATRRASSPERVLPEPGKRARTAAPRVKLESRAEATAEQVVGLRVATTELQQTVALPSTARDAVAALGHLGLPERGASRIAPAAQAAPSAPQPIVFHGVARGASSSSLPAPLDHAP